MNLILLHDSDFTKNGRVRLVDRRAQHALQVLKVAPGKQLQVGVVNGQIGIGTVEECGPAHVTLQIVLDRDPPPPSPITLILAMPRPLVFRRVLMHAISLGVKRIAIVGSARVEKSYFHTPLLAPAALENTAIEALEQAVDTVLPEITLYPLLAHFLKAQAHWAATPKWVAHVGAASAAEARSHGPALLAIGPEGGFIESEIESFKACGFKPFSLGPRILRVETAVCVALARLRLN